MTLRTQKAICNSKAVAHLNTCAHKVCAFESPRSPRRPHLHQFWKINWIQAAFLIKYVEAYMDFDYLYNINFGRWKRRPSDNLTWRISARTWATARRSYLDVGTGTPLFCTECERCVAYSQFDLFFRCSSLFLLRWENKTLQSARNILICHIYTNACSDLFQRYQGDQGPETWI